MTNTRHIASAGSRARELSVLTAMLAPEAASWRPQGDLRVQASASVAVANRLRRGSGAPVGIGTGGGLCLLTGAGQAIGTTRKQLVRSGVTSSATYFTFIDNDQECRAWRPPV